MNGLPIQHFDYTRFAISLWEVLWQGSVLLVVWMTADYLLRKRDSRIRYAAALIALALLLALMPVNFFRPRTSTASAPEAAAILSRGVSGAFAPSLAISGSPLGNRRATLAVRIPLLVTTAYACGLAFMAVRLLIAAATAWKLRTRAEIVLDDSLSKRMQQLAARVRLRASPRIAATVRVAIPGVIGAFRPVILLPACLVDELSFEQLEAVLLHELAHIRRHDALVNLCQRCVETILFFHPATWIISRRIAVLREQCCDDIVLRSHVDAALYADSLVAVSELRNRVLDTRAQLLMTAAVDASGTSLRQRVLRILGQSDEGTWIRLNGRSAVLATLLVALSLAAPTILRQSRGQPVQALEPPQKPALTADEIRRLTGDEPGEPLDNGSVKRFKFRMEQYQVHEVNTASHFFEWYKSLVPEPRPKVFACWGDPTTNSIVILAEPAAEQPIRELLANIEGQVVGIPNQDSLDAKEVYLMRERESLIREIAVIELVMVDVASGDETKRASRMADLQERRNLIEGDLSDVEKKLEVVRRNLRRLRSK